MNFSALGCIHSKERPEFLDLALSSLHKQQLKANEVILIHDGSLTDKLYSCLDQWEKKLPLKQISSPKSPRGKFLSSAINLGLKCCKYNLVAIFDSDDINRACRFKTQIEYMNRYPHVCAVSSYISDFLKIPNDLDRIRKIPLTTEKIFDYAKLRAPLNHPSAVLRKNSILSLGGYSGEIPFMEDYGLWLKLLANGKTLENIPKILVDYRVSEMVLKRKGLFHAKSEIQLYKMKRQLGFSNGLYGFFIFILRFLSRLLSEKPLNFIYGYLRKKHSFQKDTNSTIGNG